MNEENEEDKHSLWEFLDQNWLPILFAIVVVYAGFHGGINYWLTKFL